SLVVPRIIGEAIDTVSGHGERSFLIWAAVAIVIASALRGLFAYGNSYLSETASQKIAYDIRNAIYDRLQRLSFAYHDQTQTGQLMSRATADVEAARMFIGRGMPGLASMAVLLVGVTCILVSMNWQLALMTLAFLPPIAYRAIVVTRRLRPMWLKIQNFLGVLGTTLEENLTGVRVVKAFSRQKEESQKFANQAKMLYDEEIKTDRLMAFNMPLMVFLISLPTALILWYGGRQVIAGNLTIGGLTQFMFYLAMMAMPIRRVGFLTNMISRATSAGQRVLEILDATSPVQEKPSAIELNNVRGEIVFQDVSFSYNSLGPVLKDINFSARPGQLVALIGGSGSGKSTIANLIPRFYDVTGGRVTIDGTDIRDVTLPSLRRNVGIVQQDIFLFSATIRENIAYGAVDADMEQIAAAAKTARLHDFIESLPEGYNTWVGERGITLSGGEKQRLAIARTLLLNPKILILDDSTSSVDAETERFIRLALSKLVSGRTTFVITHRLSITQCADLILVLENGQIVERGTHNELMAKSSRYRQIYLSQLSASEEAEEITAEMPELSPSIGKTEGLR
ncbi:MAG: ABC transporter ATP-binding protein/permease, partial [Dehalococcoidales bacterium]|nr:ABC transporter ATP-binding protein/permease [Dehalococcoidales bacterium]